MPKNLPFVFINLGKKDDKSSLLRVFYRRFLRDGLKESFSASAIGRGWFSNKAETAFGHTSEATFMLIGVCHTLPLYPSKPFPMLFYWYKGRGWHILLGERFAQAVDCPTFTFGCTAPNSA